MRRHFILAGVFAFLCLMSGGVEAQQRLTIVGCVTAVDAAAAARSPFVLTNAVIRDEARRARGSNSPKSSTPVGGGRATPRSTPSGSNTPKGSTPLGTAALTDDSPATGRSTTAKASVPIARPDSGTTYALDAVPSELSSLTGRTVEITGAVNGQQGSAAPTLKVEQVTEISSSCAIR